MKSDRASTSSPQKLDEEQAVKMKGRTVKLMQCLTKSQLHQCDGERLTTRFADGQ